MTPSLSLDPGTYRCEARIGVKRTSSGVSLSPSHILLPSSRKPSRRPSWILFIQLRRIFFVVCLLCQCVLPLYQKNLAVTLKAAPYRTLYWNLRKSKAQGSEAEGEGERPEESRTRVWGHGFRVWGFGLRVWGFGLRVLGFR